MTDKTKPNKPGAPDTPPPATEPASGTARTAVSADAAPQAGKASLSKSPLIAAIEIENFKGIGAPGPDRPAANYPAVRPQQRRQEYRPPGAVLRPRDLSHRKVDAHKTELGGEQIDLGGFRQFVHGHDIDRVIRLRFELNLEGWRVPAPLWERVKRTSTWSPNSRVNSRSGSKPTVRPDLLDPDGWRSPSRGTGSATNRNSPVMRSASTTRLSDASAGTTPSRRRWSSTGRIPCSTTCLTTNGRGCAPVRLMWPRPPMRNPANGVCGARSCAAG